MFLEPIPPLTPCPSVGGGGGFFGGGAGTIGGDFVVVKRA